MDRRSELEQAVDRKVNKEEILAQNNLPADFVVQVTHFSVLRVLSWLAVAVVYFKWGKVPALTSLLIVGITLWKKFPVTIQEKDKTVFNFLLKKADWLVEKLGKKLDKMYTNYMNW